MILTHRKGSPNTAALTTQQPEKNLPHPTKQFLSLPVRCSLEEYGCSPGVWMHSEVLPLEAAMLLAGHGETGPGTQEEVSGGPEKEKGTGGRQGAHSYSLHTATSPVSPGCLVTALVWRGAGAPGRGTDNGTLWLGPGWLCQ